MTIHEVTTQLSPAEVLARALEFFAHTGTPAAAFAEQEGQGYLRLHMEVGEIVIGAIREGSETRVRSSASRASHLVTRFLTTLAHPLAVEQTLHRRNTHLRRSAVSESCDRTVSSGRKRKADLPAHAA